MYPEIYKLNLFIAFLSLLVLFSIISPVQGTDVIKSDKFFAVTGMNDDIYSGKDSSKTGTANHENKAVKAPVDSLSQLADSLIEFTINKLQILSNIDSNGFSIQQYDKIITFDNEVFIGKIQNITFTEVRFLYPLNTRVESLNKSKVSQIHYSGGGIDLFKPLKELENEDVSIPDEKLIVDEKKEWEKIIATENTEDIANMEEIGTIEILYEADRVQANSRYLEKNGLIRMKKRAANMQADYILVTNKIIHNGYGDLPSIRIEGKAFKSE